jgi:hypothetical protein
VKRMVVGFAGDGDKLVGEVSLGHGRRVHWVHSLHCAFLESMMDGLGPTQPWYDFVRGPSHIQSENAFAAFWSMGFGKLVLDLLR